jgi:repressor LexA
MNKIRFLRLQKALKQEDLAKIIHVSQSSLSGYENEKYEPDKKTLRRLASYFGVSIDYLLGMDSVCLHEGNVSVKIPVYSMLRSEPLTGPCGSVLFFLDFEPHWKESGEYFGIQVHGDLMEPRMFDGDIAIARRQNTVADGEIAVVQVAHQNAEILRVAGCGNGVTLIPYNPKCKVLFYSETEIAELPVKILGKVVEFHGKC